MCKCENAYFVGTVGAVFCPDCQNWDDLDSMPENNVTDLLDKYNDVIF